MTYDVVDHGPERAPTDPAGSERVVTRSERIVTAALSLFSTHGFRGTSVRMIAEAAGVSQGLLYNYYDGKDGLLRAIFERELADVAATFDEAEADAGAGGTTPLATLIGAAFRTVRTSQEFWRLSYQVRMQPEVMEGLSASIRGWSDLVRGRLEALLRRAGVPDAPVRARVLFAAIDGAAQHFVLDPEGYPLEEVARALAGLAGQPASGSASAPARAPTATPAVERPRGGCG